MKKFLAILLATMMLMTLVSCSKDTTLIESDEIVVSDNKVTNNDGLGYFTYEINRDGLYSITGYNTVSSVKHAIEIPESISDSANAHTRVCLSPHLANAAYRRYPRACIE